MDVLPDDIASLLAFPQPTWQRPSLYVSPDGVRATIIRFGTDAHAHAPPHSPAAATLKRGRWSDDGSDEPPALKRALQRDTEASPAAPEPPLQRLPASCATTTPPDRHLDVFAEVRDMFAAAPSLRRDCFSKFAKDHHKHVLLGLVPTAHLRKRLFAILTNPHVVPHLRAWAPHYLAAAVDDVAKCNNVKHFSHSLTILQTTYVLRVLHASQVIREGSPAARLMDRLMVPEGKASAHVIDAWVASERIQKREIAIVANRSLVAGPAA
jgi:hypothetical protein